MAITTASFTWFNQGKKNLKNSLIDLDGSTLKLVLCTSSYTPAPTTHEFYADITNELPTLNGYTLGGETLTGVTVTESGGTVTFDSNDVVITASGGSLTARFWVLYDDTAAGKPLIAYGFLDSTPLDVTATDGNSLTYIVNASGWSTLN